MSGIALFGGTFDPPHLGHRRLLEAAVSAVSPDRTIVMPDKIPPHKSSGQVADPGQRLEMCKLAFGDLPGVTVSNWELSREGKSYSIYTVRHLRELYPDGRLWFIMGSDMLLSFEKWYCWEELLRLCTPLCLARCKDDMLAAVAQAKMLSDITGIDEAARIVEASPVEISSTQLRSLLAEEGRAVQFMSREVLSYIKDNALYVKDKDK